MPDLTTPHPARPCLSLPCLPNLAKPCPAVPRPDVPCLPRLTMPRLTMPRHALPSQACLAKPVLHAGNVIHAVLTIPLRSPLADTAGETADVDQVDDLL